MQTHLESAFAYLVDRTAEMAIHGRLATAEHHRVQQPGTTVEEIEHRRPRHCRRFQARLQFGVVTIAATPGATLHKYHRSQLTGEIGRGQWRQAGDSKH